MQKGETKMINRLEHLPCEGKFNQLGLFSLGEKEAKGRHDRGVQSYAWFGECG